MMRGEVRPFLVTALAFLALLGTACGVGAEPAPAPTADEAVTRVTTGIADGRPETVWYALPASYQKDISDLVHDAALKLDADLWDPLWSVMGKITRILEEKREFILDNEAIASVVDERAEVERSWDAVVALADTLVNSELADLETMRELDVGRFLSGTGARLMQQSAEVSALAREDAYAEGMDTLRSMSATVVSSEGDTARVRMETADGESTEEDFVRVEGKWIPKEIADSWAGEMASMRLGIEEIGGPDWEQQKATMVIQLKMIEAALDQVLATSTKEEFDAAIGPTLGTLFGAAMGSGIVQP